MGLKKLLVRLMLAWVLVGSAQAFGQSNTRLLLASGAGVPGHTGFVFGPFASLAMNENREIVFLSTLRSARKEIPALVRSDGVSFSVLAFEGLRSPVPKGTYESFSAPNINDSGVIAFTATLKDHEEAPGSVVVRLEGANARAVAAAADAVPGHPDSTFEEFSAPLVDTQGNVLFAAHWRGKNPGVGLFLWTARGLQSLDLPAGLNLTPRDPLRPIFFSHDEAIFLARGASVDAAVEQFFRAVAIRSFQELKPSPDPPETMEVLAARPGEAPARMLLVLMEGENVQTVLLPGDPSQPVIARHPASAGLLKPLGRVQAQTTTVRGNIIFAATSADLPGDLGLYCFCEGQVIRLTSPEEFLPITQAAPGRPVLSLVGDSQQTVAFIAAGMGGEASAIYVTSLP